jgi:hypothetical protein
MPAQSEQVISSFLTQFAYEKLAVSATWRIPPEKWSLHISSNCKMIHFVSAFDISISELM